MIANGRIVSYPNIDRFYVMWHLLNPGCVFQDNLNDIDDANTRLEPFQHNESLVDECYFPAL